MKDERTGAPVCKLWLYPHGIPIYIYILHIYDPYMIPIVSGSYKFDIKQIITFHARIQLYSHPIYPPFI